MDSNDTWIRWTAGHQREGRTAWDLWRREVWVGAKAQALRGNVLGPGQQGGSGSNPVLPASVSLPAHLWGKAEVLPATSSFQENKFKSSCFSGFPAAIILRKMYMMWLSVKHLPSVPPKSAKFQVAPSQTGLDFPLLRVSFLLIFQHKSKWAWLQRERISSPPTEVFLMSSRIDET